MRIRAEVPRDYLSVHQITAAAFGVETEAKLIGVLRAQASPVVSLVAEDDGTLVGHILFSPVSLPDIAGLVMGLAPMAVAPPRQRRGIGSALVKAGLAHCKELGAVAVVVLGHPEFYPKFAHALRGASGTVKYHAVFSQL